MVEWAKYGINICAVDWGELSLETLNYFVVSQKNTVRVAKFILDVLQRFERFGMDLATTTLAGHSLGAQISGKVGATLRAENKSLGRIYGKTYFSLIIHLIGLLFQTNSNISFKKSIFHSKM